MSFRIQSSFKQPAPKVHTDEEGNEVKVVKPSGHNNVLIVMTIKKDII
jgi:hypothetical protein